MSTLVRIIPIGAVRSISLERIGILLGKKLGKPVSIGPPIQVPEKAFDEKRGQYVGPTLISRLMRLHTKIDDDVLGIVELDCYAPGLTYVFGQASMRTHTGFISLTRLMESFYGRLDNESIYIERILTECIHELGHMWGLGHCADPLCVMHFSNTLSDTDYKQSRFCEQCQGRLHDND